MYVQKLNISNSFGTFPYILPPPVGLSSTFANCIRTGSPGNRGRDVTPETVSWTMAACVVFGSLRKQIMGIK